MFKARPVVESETFASSYAKLGDPRRIDEALASVIESLAYLAHECTVVRGTKRLRVIETRPIVMRDGTTLPVFSVWFTIDFVVKDGGITEDEYVLLRHIEIR